MKDIAEPTILCYPELTVKVFRQQKGKVEIMYLKATILTIAGWFIGLVFDANIDFGDPMGFLGLRILFPILAMGLCILHEMKNGSGKR